MQGKIALEEHFAIEATLADSQVFGAHVWDELGPRLTEIRVKRLATMDENGRREWWSCRSTRRPCRQSPT